MGALKDQLVVAGLLPKDEKDDGNLAEANEIYRAAANFARYGVSKQGYSPIIKSIQSDQIERIIDFHSGLMFQLTETVHQMDQFVIANRLEQPLRPSLQSSSSLDCSILRDPTRSQMLLQVDPDSWQRLVEACDKGR